MEDNSDTEVYKCAIERNLAELQRAILNRTTLLGLEDAIKSASISHLFLRLTYDALFNDYIAHCIKVFEFHAGRRRAASFWYIYEKDREFIDECAYSMPMNIKGLKKVSRQLEHIRNNTHFHIDAVGVLNPKAIWHKEDLSGKDLSAAVDTAWYLLTNLQNLLSLPEVTLPKRYNRALVQRLAVLVEAEDDGL
ncbi:MAG: hypothetical protein ABSF52_12000 [Syntrophobacteraceae bacterium]|jgi:hypothetical protein